MAPSSRPSEASLAEALTRDSIKHRRLLEFTYEGRRRVVEPYVFGFSGGRKELLAYQVDGSATGGSVPDWYRFDVVLASAVDRWL